MPHFLFILVCVLLDVDTFMRALGQDVAVRQPEEEENKGRKY